MRHESVGLTDELIQHAKRAGLDLLGCTSSTPFPRGYEWQELDPRRILADARTVVVAACHVYGFEAPEASRPGAPRGRFGPWTRASLAAAAYGEAAITEYLRNRGYKAASARDLPLKSAAVRSGIASYGKNSIVHADGFGSYLKLSGVVTDAELVCVDRPVESSDCGDCTACVEACPTGALETRYRLAVDRCICQWLWGNPIAREDREKVGNHIFRCGFCQDACPKNGGLSPRTQFPFSLEERSDSPELIPLILGDEAYYRASLPAFTLQAGVDTLRRNVIIAAANSGDASAIPYLAEALSLPHAETRAAAAWALARLGGRAVRKALTERLAKEKEQTVRDDIEAALREIA
ncbi:MAG: epoxyqueuosine reductase [Armatimonadota bacterium]|nr:MAG: epoxyqueuosine reductase [Armatimonadota bacterium]